MTRRDITEYHTVLVPCSLSPTGKHKLTVCRAVHRQKVRAVDAQSGATAYSYIERPVIVHMSAECGRAGDAVTRLAPDRPSCAGFMRVFRLNLGPKVHVRRKVVDVWAEETVRIDPDTKVPIAEWQGITAMPDGVRDVVWTVCSAADAVRRERVPLQPDERPLLVRLLERYASHAARIPVYLSIGSDGTRSLSVERQGSGHFYGSKPAEIAMRRVGAPWMLVPDNVRHRARHLGTRGNYCLVCPEADGKKWDNVSLHARGEAHKSNVVRQFDQMIKRLNKLTWRLPDEGV